jgi:MSHA biogenesis protein MshJ
MSFKARFESAAGWYNARPVRERGLLLLTCAVLLALASWQWLVAPNLAIINQQQAQKRQLAQQQTQLSEQVGVLSERANGNPAARLQARIDREQAVLAQLDAEIDSATDSLIAPQAMVSLLRTMLAAQQDLQLERLDLLTPTSVYGANHDPKAPESEWPDPLFYAHDVELVIAGGYLELLGYLRELESLDPRLGWQSLEYQIDTFPAGRARLKVRTLSLKKAWLGV